MIEYTVDFTGLNQQLAKFEQFPEIVEKHLTAAMAYAVEQVAQAARPIAPGSIGGSIDTEVRHMAAMAVDGVVKANTDPPIKGIVQEYGRRPGARMPPPDAFGGGAAGYVIARAIGRHGTQGKRYLWHGFMQNKAAIITRFNQALEDIAEELAVNGGGNGA